MKNLSQKFISIQRNILFLSVLLLTACGAGDGDPDLSPPGADSKAKLLQLHIKPTISVLVRDNPVDISVVARFDDDSEQVVTADVNWVVTPENALSLGLVTGETRSVQATTAGPINASLVYQAFRQAIDIEVIEGTPDRVELLLERESLTVGEQIQARLRLHFGQRIVDVTAMSEWSSDAPALLDANNQPAGKGVLKALMPGVVTIQAIWNEQTFTRQVEVLAPVPQAVDIRADKFTLAPQSSLQLSAWVMDTSGATELSTGIQWQLLKGGDLATISETGLLQAQNQPGEVEVAAIVTIMRNGQKYVFEPGKVLQIVEIPEQLTIDTWISRLYESESYQFQVMAVFNGVNTRPDYPLDWSWESDDGGVIEVSDSGLVTAISAGTVRVTASLAGIASQSEPVNIYPRLQSVELGMASADWHSGQSVSLQAYGLDRFNQRYDDINIANAFDWVADKPDMLELAVNGSTVSATVSTIATLDWPVELTATHKIRSGLSAKLKIAPVSSLKNTPQNMDLATGESQPVNVIAQLENGELSANVTDLSDCIVSHGNTVVSVTDDCWVTGMQAGQATVSSIVDSKLNTGMNAVSGDNTLVTVHQGLVASSVKTDINANLLYRVTGVTPGQLYHIKIESTDFTTSSGLSLRARPVVIDSVDTYCENSDLSTGQSFYVCNLHAADSSFYLQFTGVDGASARVSVQSGGHVASPPFVVRPGSDSENYLLHFIGAAENEDLTATIRPVTVLGRNISIFTGSDKVRRPGDMRNTWIVDARCSNQPPEGGGQVACGWRSGQDGFYVEVQNSFGAHPPVLMEILQGRYLPVGSQALPQPLVAGDIRLNDSLAVYGPLNPAGGRSYYRFDNVNCNAPSFDLVFRSKSILPGNGQYVTLAVEIEQPSPSEIYEILTHPDNGNLLDFPGVASGGKITINNAAGQVFGINVSGYPGRYTPIDTAAALGGANYEISLSANCPTP